MKTPTEFDKAQRLHESCRAYRAGVLHHCTILEEAMDILIAHHFIGIGEDFLFKRLEFIGLVLNSEGVSWSTKKEIANNIISTYCDEFMEIHKSDNPTFKTRLENIISERNILAHRNFIVLPSDLEKNIDYSKEFLPIDLWRLKAAKKGLKKDSFLLSEEIIEQKQKEIADVTGLIEDATDELIKKAKSL